MSTALPKCSRAVEVRHPVEPARQHQAALQPPMTRSSLFNYRITPGNFGDDLNDLFMREILGGAPVAPFYQSEDTSKLPSDAVLALCIGTILNRRVPTGPTKIVLGSGAGYGPPPVLDATWTVRFVRGPLTARTLDLPNSLACAARLIWRR